MKIVSFEIAKALKEVGYPQDRQRYQYGYEGNLVDLVRDGGICYGPVAPTYLEAWLWLWRTKNISIDIDYLHGIFWGAHTYGDYIKNDDGEPEHNDPEEAIIAAIEYLVKNNLIK